MKLIANLRAVLLATAGFQGKLLGAINRFDPGGMGTAAAPDIRWYFEPVRRLNAAARRNR